MTARVEWKIVGAKPGTVAYQHEVRHIWQDEQFGIHTKMSLYTDFAMIAIATLAAVYPVTQSQYSLPLIQLFAGLYVLYYLTTELDAWIHGYKTATVR